MHRSSSTTRASEFFLHGSSSASASSVTSSSRTASTLDTTTDELLPVYDPLSEFAKKEKLRMKFAENAVHVIPLVLLVCGLILWVLSNPDVEINKDSSIAARIEGLTIDGDVEVAHSQTSLLSSSDLEDLGSTKPSTYQKRGRLIESLI
ncbi:hypothetical protein IFM89_002867 [Coptis chinensis]|uniref:Transmembrane protein n=1 Tax=Coptis chinensis TaxID=261450 RepID=A0A835H3S5_9MAGN|nr:hypothetical protein IFM89_002867 [Coptis chinensis]